MMWSTSSTSPSVTIISAVAALPRLPLQHTSTRAWRRPDHAPVVCSKYPSSPSSGLRRACTLTWRRIGLAAWNARRVPPPGGVTCLRPPVCRPYCLVGPLTRLVRMAKPAPQPQLVAQLFVHFLTRLSATDRREVMAPSPNDRVEGFNQPRLPIHPMSPDHGCDLLLVLCHGPAARGDDGLIPALGLRRILPDVESPKVKPGSPRFGVPRVGRPGFARLPCHIPSRAIVPPSTPGLARSLPDPDGMTTRSSA